MLWTFFPGLVTVTDLGTLGGGFATAISVNDAGEVTGWSENGTHVSHAYLWSPRKRIMTDLGAGTITGGGYSINASGQLAGDMFPDTQHGGF